MVWRQIPGARPSLENNLFEDIGARYALKSLRKDPRTMKKNYLELLDTQVRHYGRVLLPELAPRLCRLPIPHTQTPRDTETTEM